MSPRVSRREQLVEHATRLFVEQGYHATSVRQITQAADCNEAALYYHFPKGKRELLQAVIEEQTPDLVDALEHCQAAATLYDLIQQLGQRLTTFGITRLKIIRWLYGEFYRFNDEERAVVYARWLEFHQGLTKLITRFISDQDEAERTAWLVMCTLFGYGQLFFNLELRAVATFEAATMTDMLAALLSQTLPPT